MAKLRLAFGRIAQETNALSPVLTTLEDFDSTIHMSGEALLAACMPGGDEAPGFTKNAELSGCVKAALADGDVELVPLSSAWAIPGGPLSRECFDTLLGELEDKLVKAGPVDACFLSVHGAMNAVGVPNPDARIAQVVKERIGSAPLGVSMDLHGSLNPTLTGAADLIYAYKTNPHRDHARIGRQCTTELLRAARGQSRPTAAWRTLPMILGGGATVDFLRPMRSIFRWMRQQEKQQGVLGMSLFMCHLWNDTPELGWCTYAATDGDQARAEELAEALAEKAWAVKDEMPPEFDTPQQAIERVRKARIARRFGTVCICDASDVVPAGSTGESTHLLRAFLEGGQDLLVYIPMRDPVAVGQCWEAELGQEVSLQVGGRLDPARNQGLDITGRLLWKGDRHAFGRTVALEVGKTRLVVTSGPAIAMKPSFYSEVGLSPWKADVVVVKSFFPFHLFFLLEKRKSIYVRSGGITDFDAARELEFARPVHPFQQVSDWRPADRARRGV